MRFSTILPLSLVFTVQFYDEPSQLAILKTSRDSCDAMRSAVTMLTTVKQQPVVATTLSISGSLRTAKICALHELRVWFDSSLQDTKKNVVMEKKIHALLEEQMKRVRNLE